MKFEQEEKEGDLEQRGKEYDFELVVKGMSFVTKILRIKLGTREKE